ncbi:MAG: hypothetical protein IJK91_02320 [Bacteroidales bacterium]|nr:hypothetical protein [Bacteroidales bacterium]
MKRFFSTILIISVMVASACVNKDFYNPPDSHYFLPGECLQNTDLDFDKQGMCNDAIRFMTLGFSFPLKNLRGTGVYVPITDELTYGNYAHFEPDDEIFNTFGDNSGTVHSLYTATYRKTYNVGFYSSILYNTGISLVADTDFAGVKAGDNIAYGYMFEQDWEIAGRPEDVPGLLSFCPVKYIFDDYWNLEKPFGDEFSDYACFNGIGFGIFIPTRDFEEVEEDVTFTLSIPVKVGLYLTWLNDKISDPDAPFPYRDETLTCTFTIHKGLH